MTNVDLDAARYGDLDFNAPLSDGRADALISSLRPLRAARVVDLGCGWAELLLRVLAAEPTAVGVGVDHDLAGLERGRQNARARGLDDRAELLEGDAATWTGGPTDVVIAIGVSHVWGGTRSMLETIRRTLRPGDRLLVGEGFWERPPTPEALTALRPEPDELRSLADLVDLALGCRYRQVGLSVANLDEWDAFESGWCAGRERWLLDHPDAPEADAVRAAVDEHRDGWLRGYRGVLGFAYLTLVAVDDAP